MHYMNGWWRIVVAVSGNAWTFLEHVIGPSKYYIRQSRDEWRRVSHCTTNWWASCWNVVCGDDIQTINPDVFRGAWGGHNCRDSPAQVGMGSRQWLKVKVISNNNNDDLFDAEHKRYLSIMQYSKNRSVKRLLMESRSLLGFDERVW